MDWWNILLYGIIPVFAVAVLFLVKRRLLWTAPLLSTVLFFVTYIIALRVSGVHLPILQLFSYSEFRGFFLLVVLFQLGIVIALTAAAGFAAYLLKRKKN